MQMLVFPLGFQKLFITKNEIGKNDSSCEIKLRKYFNARELSKKINFDVFSG